MFSHLIIYFMLGRIFHFNSFKNPFWDFTHAVINNALLVLMSNGWVWENLIKVQTGFTSFLSPLRTFLNISFAALSQDFGACHKSRQKKMPPLLQIAVTFQSQSLDGFWNLTKPVCGNKHNETFVSHCATWQLALTPLLKYLHMECNPSYDTGVRTAASAVRYAVVPEEILLRSMWLRPKAFH